MGLFKRSGGSGFSSSSTAEKVTEGIDGSGLTAIVTGASSGIGVETTRVLAKRGVHVVMAIRNMAAGKQVQEKLVKENPSAKIDVMELDLSSMESVRQFASEFKSSCLPLNILINNAGIMIPPFSLSKDGIEMQFATNYVGHFLLTHLLLDTMKKTAHETKREGRIVVVSSSAHAIPYKEGIRFDRINEEKGYGKWGAYGQSKLANILHTNELARRLKEEGANITVNSLHPGVVTTNLFRTAGIFGSVVNTIGRLMLKNVEQGASTSCYLALNPQVSGVAGKYFADNNEIKPHKNTTDTEMARKLWDFSLDLINK